MELDNHHSPTIILYSICTGLLILCTYSLLPSFLRVTIGTDAFAQESAVTSPEGLSCGDESIPDTSTGLCADGFAPQSNLSEFTSASPPLGSPELTADNVTTINNNTAGQDLLSENELASGGIIASAPAPEEIQMDTNGDGIVDETESQNQPIVAGNTTFPEEIQMDTNGDGIVDETESQNQLAVSGNALPSEEIQMDTNGDGIVDETESQNTIGAKTGVQGPGGPRTQTQSCEGDFAARTPPCHKNIGLGRSKCKGFCPITASRRWHQAIPEHKSVLVR